MTISYIFVLKLAIKNPAQGIKIPHAGQLTKNLSNPLSSQYQANRRNNLVEDHSFLPLDSSDFQYRFAEYAERTFQYRESN